MVGRPAQPVRIYSRRLREFDASSHYARPIGAYSRRKGRVDGRTRSGAILREIHAKLLAHLGRPPNHAETLIIERVGMLQLRLVMLDAKILQADGEFTELDSKVYLAWSNSLRRALKVLGIERPNPPATPAALRDYLAEGTAA